MPVGHVVLKPYQWWVLAQTSSGQEGQSIDRARGPVLKRGRDIEPEACYPKKDRDQGLGYQCPKGQAKGWDPKIKNSTVDLGKKGTRERKGAEAVKAEAPKRVRCLRWHDIRWWSGAHQGH